jgi:release factor glutamine methyltransferase
LQARIGGDRHQEARWIVERVSGFSAAELIVHGAEPVSARGVAFFDQLVARRGSGEPLQYVLGRWGFRNLELFVDSRVLIPRPETEVVAGLGVSHLLTYGCATRAADLGCGSGAIGLSLAVEVPSCSVWLGDVSSDALEVARANASGLGRAGARVSLHQGSWFDALPPDLAGTLDLVISNPPYVAPAEELPHEVVGYEPGVALFSDDHAEAGQSDDSRTVGGAAHLVAIVDAAPRWLAPGGALVLEMSPHQTAFIAQRCADLGFTSRVERDLAGRDRAVVALWPA